MPRTADSKQALLAEGKVYLKKRGEKGWDIWWLEAGVEMHEFRRLEERAREYAARVQRRLASPASGVALPFGDTVLEADGTAGDSWVELLWRGSLTVAQNPANEAAQAALRSIASAAQGARKFIRSDRIGEGGDVSDEEVVEQFVALVAQRLAGYESITAEERTVALKVLQGGLK